jgi:glycine cleavage system regulatory protein
LENLSKNLKLIIEKVSSENYEEVRQIVEVRLIGNDRPGIIREISKTVTDLAVNFEKLTSECVPAPMSGDALFKASASLKIPQGVSVDLLKHALENLADDLIVEIK